MSEKYHLNLLIFELTDACNQACKFCYNHWKGGDSFGYSPVRATYKEAHKVLKTVFRQASIGSISFSGGEPMLLPDIEDLLFYARLHRTNVSLLTNGTLLDDERLENMLRLGIGRIQIPLMSARAETHDAVTQLSGSWAKAVDAIRRVVAHDANLCTAVLIVNRQNLNEIDETLSLFDQLGVKSVLVNRFNIGGLGRQFREEMELSIAQIQEAFGRINRFAQQHRDIQFMSGVCTPLCVLDPKDYERIAFSFCNTDVNRRPITINHRGNVRFCNHSPNVLGNIFERPLSEILSGVADAAYFRSTPTFCIGCERLERCVGGCRAASEQVYRRFDVVDPILAKGI